MAGDLLAHEDIDDRQRRAITGTLTRAAQALAQQVVTADHARNHAPA